MGLVEFVLAERGEGQRPAQTPVGPDIIHTAAVGVVCGGDPVAALFEGLTADFSFVAAEPARQPIVGSVQGGLEADVLAVEDLLLVGAGHPPQLVEHPPHPAEAEPPGSLYLLPGGAGFPEAGFFQHPGIRPSSGPDVRDRAVVGPFRQVDQIPGGFPVQIQHARHQIHSAGVPGPGRAAEAQQRSDPVELFALGAADAGLGAYQPGFGLRGFCLPVIGEGTRSVPGVWSLVYQPVGPVVHRLAALLVFAHPPVRPGRVLFAGGGRRLDGEALVRGAVVAEIEHSVWYNKGILGIIPKSSNI